MVKNLHPDFIEYQKFIINHENYKGLYHNNSNLEKIKWYYPLKSNSEGQKKVEWAFKTAKKNNLKYNKLQPLKDIMFTIHPTKKKPCSYCGMVLNLNYIYMNKYFRKDVKKQFDIDTDYLTTIFELSEELILENKEEEIKKYFLERFKVSRLTENSDIDEIVKECISSSFLGKNRNLGPGAMSNFPDRLDGFHTYNRCCRQKQDKGRSKDNLATYSKDRRAFEYLVDGNLRAADKYMKSDTFNETSADHIGPISLGFIHDPLNLTPLSISENSSKRNKLLKTDVDKIIEIENENDTTLMSWFNFEIWNYYKESSEQINLSILRDALLEGQSTYLTLLNYLFFQNTSGRIIIEKLIIEPKLEYFNYNYEFIGGEINELPRRVTKNTKKELLRFRERVFTTIKNYSDKKNRRKKIILDEETKYLLKALKLNETLKNDFKKIIFTLQDKIISEKLEEL